MSLSISALSPAYLMSSEITREVVMKFLPSRFVEIDVDVLKAILSI